MCQPKKTQPKISNSKSALQDAFDDLSVQFIMNCPAEEFQSFERLFFQLEQAHWFYEDFMREQSPSLRGFKLQASLLPLGDSVTEAHTRRTPSPLLMRRASLSWWALASPACAHNDAQRSATDRTNMANMPYLSTICTMRNDGAG